MVLRLGFSVLLRVVLGAAFLGVVLFSLVRLLVRCAFVPLAGCGLRCGNDGEHNGQAEDEGCESHFGFSLGWVTSIFALRVSLHAGVL